MLGPFERWRSARVQRGGSAAKDATDAGAELVDEVSSYLEMAASGPVEATDKGGSSAKTILLPYGRSTASIRALEVTVELFAALPVNVRVMHVRERQLTQVGPVDCETGAEAAACVDEAVARLRCHGIAATGVIREGGHDIVANLILAEAKQMDASVIVVGARPRHALITMIAGSTTRPVLRQADCPVLLVHP